MQTYELEFLELIKHYFFKSPITEIHDYESIYELAREQNLLPIIYESCRQLNSFQQTNHSIQQKMMNGAIGQIITQQQYDVELERIYHEFLQQDLHPLVLKGKMCRLVYPQPDYRVSTDEDLLIEVNDYPKYARILENNGYICQAKGEVDEKMLAHTQTVNFTNHQLTLELHIHPFGTYHELNKRMNTYFGDVHEQSCYVEPFYTLAPTKQYLFLIFHLYKHFLSSGVGVRQLLDLVLYKQAYSNEIDFQYIQQVLEELHITKLYDALMQCANNYLGFSYSSPLFKQKLEPLMENLLSSGCVGTINSDNIYSAAFTHSFRHKEEGHLFSQICYLLFPSLQRMQDHYPNLKKHPIRLPLYWFKRYWDLITKIKSKEFNINESIKIARNREKVYKQYDIRDRD
mgnify:CR=1 FL=1